MISEKCKKILIKPNFSLKAALKQIDKSALQVLIVVDEEDRILGIVTDGDMRRAIIKGLDFKTPIQDIMTKNPIIISYKSNKEEALRLMKKYEARHIPVVNEKNKIIDIFLWKDFLKNGEVACAIKSVPVIIMAGGKGRRLDPFTKILPKPLIPIDEKPVIEVIMDNFKKYGFSKFIIALNYKAEMIKMYFAENPNNYQIEYIQEKDFLGTIGALSLIKDRLVGTSIVSNCDVVIDANYDDLLNYHKQNNNQITILGVSRNINIPYGILNMKNECADFEEIIEKPDYHFIVNSGLYILESEVIDLIPINQPLDMPDLLVLAKKKGFKIQVYPANCSWFDIGEWEEYKKAMEYIKRFGE
ncbi:MAG: sugar phosphate nucleotidyltransferase [Actinomycetota bacterium]|nr:sugar phosphate nucleotidyltransferase [Actinomycetota bacterium]